MPIARAPSKLLQAWFAFGITKRLTEICPGAGGGHWVRDIKVSAHRGRSGWGGTEQTVQER